MSGEEAYLPFQAHAKRDFVNSTLSTQRLHGVHTNRTAWYIGLIYHPSTTLSLLSAQVTYDQFLDNNIILDIKRSCFL